jgi:hypothetical protein
MSSILIVLLSEVLSQKEILKRKTKNRGLLTQTKNISKEEA